MKSHLESCPVSDAGPPTDREWERVVLDLPELLQAVRENGVHILVRDVLRAKHGQSPVFGAVVSDVTESVLVMVASRLEQATGPYSTGAAVLLDASLVRKAEESLRVRVQQAESLAYWRGENVPVRGG